MDHGTHLTESKKRFSKMSRNLLIFSAVLLLSTLLLAALVIRETHNLENSVNITETIVNANVRTLMQTQRELLRLMILLEQGENDSDTLTLQKAFITQRVHESSLSYQMATLGAEELLERADRAEDVWLAEVSPLIDDIIAEENDDDHTLREEAVERLKSLELEFNELVSQGEINRRQEAGRANTVAKATLQSTRRLLGGLILTLCGLIGFVYYTIRSYQHFDKQREADAHRLLEMNQEMHKLSLVASQTNNLVIIADGEGRVE
ncbi:MAG: hypothetical protein KDE51_27325, partial [Anaerolineales bacterium]|nr:hypothetical protein [Anaerolineales bacterium]